MEFTTGPVPTKSKRGRPALPNPFVDKFPTSVDEEGEPQAVIVSVEGNDTQPLIARLTRQARQAARDIGKTARVQTEYDATEDVTVFYAWTIEKIERKTS